jgi:hypothetical protein
LVEVYNIIENLKNMRVFAFFILFLMVFSQTIDCLNTIRLNEHISL